ncbi:MAG: hypothetical protein NC085_06235, partial [Muribaculaceae bacterium]|nr:hypothetical protein [Muribaculaceae bacterium]
MYKKFLSAAIFSLAILLTSCSKGGGEVTENISETSAETAAVTETAAEITETAAETETETFSICGKEYGAEDIYIEIDGNSLTEKDIENIRGMKNLSAASIENPSPQLVETLAENPNITKIKFVKFDGDIAEYIEVLKNFDIVFVDALAYSGKNSALLYGELSDASVFYQKNSDSLSDPPEDGLALSATDCVMPNGNDGFDTWTDCPETLTVFISNFTDTAETAQKLELFYESENGGEAVRFTNGENFLPLDITAEPHAETPFTVDGEPFDYKNAPTGVYK